MPDSSTIASEDVTVQLKRLFLSPQFSAKAKNPRKLLSHVIDCALFGKFEELTESHLEQLLDGFDPNKKGSLVRVVIREIRLRLTAYYATTPGSRDPILISIPKSSKKAGYVPRFERNPQYEQIEHIARALSDFLGQSIPIAVLQDRLDEPFFRLDVHIRYFQGVQLASQRTLAGFQKAIECFNEVLAVEPKYGKAYTGIAESYIGSAQLFEPPDQVLTKAAEAAQRALEINDGLWEAHAAMGTLKMMLYWDWQGAQNCFDKAEHLNPAGLSFYIWHGIYLVAQGSAPTALVNVDRRLGTEPNNANFCTNVGLFRFAVRDYETAELRILQARDLDPHSYRPHMHHALVCVARGKYADAVTSIEQAVHLFPVPQKLFGFRAVCLAADGHHAGAREALNEMEAYARDNYISPLQFALAYQSLNEMDRAVQWLEKACDTHEPLTLWLNYWPTLDPMRRHPRFPALLEKMKLPAAACNQATDRGFQPLVPPPIPASAEMVRRASKR